MGCASNLRRKSVLEFWQQDRDRLFQEHPHIVLSTVSAFGLLQQLPPDEFHDEVKWADIFSDLRLYRTDLVEKLGD